MSQQRYNFIVGPKSNDADLLRFRPSSFWMMCSIQTLSYFVEGQFVRDGLSEPPVRRRGKESGHAFKHGMA